MKKLTLQILFLAANLAIPSLTSAKAIPVTIYCDDAYLPYSFADKNHEAQGIYTDVLLKAFESMPDYKVTIKPLPWARAMVALEKNDVFAVYPPYYRPIDRPFIKDYSVPLIEEIIVVYARKEDQKGGLKNWPRDWFGKKVGIFTGTKDIAGIEFNKALKEKKITMIEAKSNEENLRNLITHKIDAYVNDRNAILYTLAVLKKQNHWPTNAPEIQEVAIVSKESGYLAFSQDDKKFPYKDDFLKKLNIAISKMQKNNEVEKIMTEYFKHISGP